MPRPAARITVNGVTLAYDDVGVGSAVLFIHGFMFDRTMWRDQVEALDGWRRISPDLRGMGESEAPDGGYGMDVYADDLVALLDALRVDRAVLCGLSLGGYVAFELLRRHRERVAGLIVMDARAEADTPERRTERDAMIARVRERGAKAAVHELAPKFLSQDAPGDVRERLGQMLTRAPVSGIVGALGAMRDRADSRPLLRTLSGTPTLLVVGERDARTPRSSMQAMLRQIPDARLQIIAGAGHLPPIEQPEATARTLKTFLTASAEHP